MSARYDMEATKPEVGQLRARVESRRVQPVGPVTAQSFSHAGLFSTGGVA